MKKLILKTLFFTLPFFILYFLTNYKMQTYKGDLQALGYIPNIKTDYRDIFENEFKKKLQFKLLSKTKPQKIKVLTIGDSFSQLENVGYQNYLSDSIKNIVNVDLIHNQNPVLILNGLLEGDFFDQYPTQYVILESVEREFVGRNTISNDLKPIYVKYFDSLFTVKNKKKVEKEDFFSDKSFKFIIYNLKYYLGYNYLNKIIRFDVNQNLFSVSKNELLVYSDDNANSHHNNNIENIKKLNLLLNDFDCKLKKKGIKLIVLPCPDKFDFYYEYIQNKKSFIKPLFFDLMKKMKKDYVFIESKDLLSKALPYQKDIYYFDDTHWSPFAAKIIAKELSNKITELDNFKK